MESQEDKKLIFVVLYGTAAMGKSYFLKNHFQDQCKEANINCHVISFDEMNSKLHKQLMAEDPSMTENTAFHQSFKVTLGRFSQKIEELTKNLKPGKNIIVLDAMLIDDLVKNLKKSYNPGCSTKLVAIIPQTSYFEYGSNEVVPFSQTLIANALYRILKRDDHPTLDDRAPQDSKIIIALSHAKVYEGLKSFTEKSKEGIIDEFIEINFSPVEDPEKEKAFPPKFTELLQKTLHELKPFDVESKCASELAQYTQTQEYFDATKQNFGFGNEEIQKEQIARLFDIFNTM